MSKENGGPAFPVEVERGMLAQGMTLRDKFAESALPLAATRHTQTYVDNSGHTSEYLPESAYQQTAQDAYAMADAMLLERAK